MVEFPHEQWDVERPSERDARVTDVVLARCVGMQCNQEINGLCVECPDDALVSVMHGMFERHVAKIFEIEESVVAIVVMERRNRQVRGS